MPHVRYRLHSTVASAILARNRYGIYWLIALTSAVVLVVLYSYPAAAYWMFSGWLILNGLAISDYLRTIERMQRGAFGVFRTERRQIFDVANALDVDPALDYQE